MSLPPQQVLQQVTKNATQAWRTHRFLACWSPQRTKMDPLLPLLDLKNPEQVLEQVKTLHKSRKHGTSQENTAQVKKTRHKSIGRSHQLRWSRNPCYRRSDPSRAFLLQLLTGHEISCNTQVAVKRAKNEVSFSMRRKIYFAPYIATRCFLLPCMAIHSP